MGPGSTQPCVTLQGDIEFIPVFDQSTEGVMRYRANVACDRGPAQTSEDFLHAPARSESERASGAKEDMAPQLTRWVRER